MKFKILPITADASFRKFYRLILNKKKKNSCYRKKGKIQKFNNMKKIIKLSNLPKFSKINS